MSMLSSVAERLYWMARYLQRAEETACLTNAYSHFVLDIPKGLEPGWASLIRIIDGQQAFDAHYNVHNERNVIKFLLSDLDNQGSIRSSVKAARENVRTTRDVLPEQCWELVNELHIFAGEQAEASIARRNRFQFLDALVAGTQQITGLMESSLRRDQAYRFIRMGRFIERSDMTSRVVDVATATALSREDSLSGEEDWLWSNLLKSLSAVSAYRRESGPLIIGSDVVDFVFKSELFPGSILYCLRGLEQEARTLKRGDAVASLAAEIAQALLEFEGTATTLTDLHAVIDRLQEQLIALDSCVSETWFSH